MSAEDDRDDVADDFDVTKEINKVLKELLKHMKSQEDIIKKGNKARADENKSFHLTYEQKKELKAIDDQRIKENIHLRASLKGAQTQMQMFTGLMKRGATIGTVFSTIVGKSKGLASSFEEQKNEIDELTKKIANLDELLQSGKGSQEEQQGWEREKKEKQGTLDTKQKEFSSQGKLGKGLFQMGQFAKKHMAGILLGAAAAGTLLKVLKMAFDVSPMFQAVKKLLNFGIMMVLRPIGDFFGFLLRPIMVWMLRKLIIPFYQTYLPVAQQMGTDIGNYIVGFFEFVSNFFGKIDRQQKVQEEIGISAAVSASELKSILAEQETGNKDITAAIDLARKNTITAYLQSTASADQTLGKWRKHKDMLFGEREIKGYNVEGVGNDIPLEQAAVDFYRDMGKKVTAVYTQRGTHGDSTDPRSEGKFGAGSGRGGTIHNTFNFNVEGTVIAEQELEDIVYNAVEKAETRTGSPR